MKFLRTTTIASATFLVSGLAGTAPAGATVPTLPFPVHVVQAAEQDVAPQPGSEPDTLVEPDIAVSPINPLIAVASAHDGRYPDGGAVAITYAWTHDGGRTWHHQALPKLTKATGGIWDRASDPVVAFGPDGTVYISTLAISEDCPSAVAVSRSDDGGRTFGAPILAHESTTCAVSDDKNWLVVDTSRRSPHRGRLYQFWTPFLSDEQGNTTGSPQVVRWSDDKGRHWSETVNVSATDIFTQNSQPMILADGTIVDTYLNFGTEQGEEGPERPGTDVQSRPRVTQEEEGEHIVARTSRDGGRTWSPEVLVTDDSGEGPEGIRCCLPSATIDPVTNLMYVAWDSAEPDAVKVSTSRDGRRWSAPVEVTRGGGENIHRVNVDVSAWGGRVFVAYMTQDASVENGRFLQQQLSASYDGGRHFGAPISLAPPSDTRFAAIARGIFPGDYMGTAATFGRIYVAWARSSAPANPTAQFHQTLFVASLIG